MPAVFDIVIIGGGIAGASLAYFLAPHRSVLVLEKEDHCGYHSTGRSAAEFTERFHSPVSGKLTRASHDFLRQPPKGFSQVALLRRRGNLIVADPPKARHLEQVFHHDRDRFPDLRRLSVDAAIERVPFLRRDYLAAAFFDPDCWDIEVENLLQGYLREARKNGTILRTRTEVTALHREAGLWVIGTSSGDPVRAGIVVNAAGAWADEIARLANVTPIGLTPRRRTVITVDVPGVDVSALPEITEIDEVFYFKPEGGRLMASPADATESLPCDAQPEDIDVAYGAHYLTMATTLDVRRIRHKWAGLRSFAPDRKPVVGYSVDGGEGGDRPGFFWLAGQGGYGIQTSPALGAGAASLLLHGCLTPALGAQGLTADEISPARIGA